jgi:hypothetical protein
MESFDEKMLNFGAVCGINVKKLEFWWKNCENREKRKI